jgi:thymidylate synthase
LFHFNTEELTLAERLNIVGTEKADQICSVAFDSYNKVGTVEEELNDLKVPKHRLNLLLYQRSLDLPLGGPFNISSYCLLLCMVAQCIGMEPGVFTWSIGDCHIYKNQLPMIEEQLKREPRKLPSLVLNATKKDLFDFTYDDIKLVGYDPHPKIEAPIAV